MDSRPSTVVVFGGAGFIGHHLVKHVLNAGAYRVVSVDIRAPNYPVPGVEYLKGDVRDLTGFPVDGTIDTIYNLAAVHTTPGHPAHAYYETNVAGAVEITALARRAKVNEIVFTSSISVYGSGESRKNEQSPVAPESPYGWSKYLAERVHRAWLDESEDRRLTIVRPAVVFGPHEGGNFTRMARLLKKGFFVYPGRTDTIKACIYVGDLVEAIDHARRANTRAVLFNGCYPDRYTISDIVRNFRLVSFPKVREFCIPSWAVKGAAYLLRPASFLGLGIHPDRVTKLMRSTDIYPGWLVENGAAKTGRLAEALTRWRDQNDYG